MGRKLAGRKLVGRHQILLTDWQTEFIKKLKKATGISQSGAVRMLINGSITDELKILIKHLSKEKDTNITKYLSDLNYNSHKKADEFNY